MTTTDNRIFVDAPIDLVWNVTNNVRLWPELFTEYEQVEVIEDGPPVVFRLTTRPDPDGRTWSWVSERTIDRSTLTARARRRETGPFEYMNIRWDYRTHGAGTVMRWRQDFAVKPEFPFSEEAMKDRLEATTAEQMVAVARSVETRSRGRDASASVNIHNSDHAKRLLTLTCGSRLFRLVETVTDLQVADALANGPLKIEQLAEKVAAHPPTLQRVLRALATVDVFAEEAPGVFTHTPLSRFLIESHPYSLTPLVRHSGSRIIEEPLRNLPTAVRTGGAQARSALGSDVWSFLAANDSDAAAFDDAMTRLGGWEIEQHVAAVSPQRFTEIIDVGGGQGRFLAACLDAAPNARGVLVERESVLQEAQPVLEFNGVVERVRTQIGDAFSMAPWPPGPNRAVILKAVLHNWDDDHAARALSTVGNSLDESGRVFLIEQVVAPGNTFDHAKWLDLDMMLTFGGRERTQQDWQELLSRAGLKLVNEPTPGRWGVLECKRAAA